jgi:glycosyltransferase involved in cell wall biosynthesis
VPSVLILTQYYPPETGAPQNRLSSLARHLKSSGVEISVLTAMPNYPAMKIHEGYAGKWYEHEILNDIPVHRSWIFVKKTNSIVLRLLNYFSFVFSSILVGLFKIRKHDIIICESPPLFLGISALALKLLKGSKLVINVSDLWPESAEKLGIINNKFLLNITYKLEARLYKSTALVSGQTQGIVTSISSRFPKVKTHWLPNGIDIIQTQENIPANWRSENGFKPDDFIVLYAGILGYAQALEVILKAAALVTDKKVKFVIVGDGPQRDFLHQLNNELGLNNVHFFGNQPTEAMPAIIDAVNAAIVPLKNIPLFKGAIPSKIFENLAAGKPILLGVDGEARELFIDDGNCGLFYTPDNEYELAVGIVKLNNDPELCKELGNNGMKYVREKFDRRKIAEAFHEQLLKI